MMKNIYHGKAVGKTEHPHIIKVRGVGSGEPIILGIAVVTNNFADFVLNSLNL
jgi:hypothetical protein